MFNVTLKEKRSFTPPSSFVKGAALKPSEIRKWLRLGKTNPTKYWAQAALDLRWQKKWSTVLKGKFPKVEWFCGGKLNASENCLDRHCETQPQKAALIWEAENGAVTTWTYGELLREVKTLAAALRGLGLKPGDCVAIYLPLIPEAVVAMLACARVGLPHTVVFGGFSADALKDRMQDARAVALITADGGYRKGVWLDLNTQVDRAVQGVESLKHIVRVRRADAGALRSEGLSSTQTSSGARVRDWHELMNAVTPESRENEGFAAILPSEHPLFILYTSGTTGKPKGLVHTTGGYLTGVLRSMKLVFDLKPNDLYWCTADIGWITGHSYVVYGPLAAGATVFMYEGAPMTPEPDRFWKMIARHGITILYTAPTAIRAFMRLDRSWVDRHDLRSLRLLGTVGEPINPEAWMWYRDVIGKKRCPIVDTYWQTETGSIVLSALPALSRTKPGSASQPLPGYDVAIVDKSGKAVPKGKGGYLIIRKPWPSMARTIHGDAERFRETYFAEHGVYTTGDGARQDAQGDFWCLGRVDDVLNISGHRIGTMEVESALVGHPDVAEAAVVGRPDELKGQALVAYVTLKASAPSRQNLDQAKTILKAHVVQSIGALARPDEIRFTDGLPKTRSGKIMRRLLRELASNGKVAGDTTTLEDLQSIVALQASPEDE